MRLLSALYAQNCHSCRSTPRVAKSKECTMRHTGPQARVQQGRGQHQRGCQCLQQLRGGRTKQALCLNQSRSQSVALPHGMNM